jgi:hypothetical protein
MKKLLMLGAILALGTTMAYGEGETTGKATADVKVIAEIVDDSFIITDLDGKDIVLDFQRIPAKAYEMDTARVKEVSEGFKITYTGAGNFSSGSGNGVNLTFSLKGVDEAGDSTAASTGTPTVVTMRRQVTSGDKGGEGNDIIKSNIFLGEYSAKIAGNTTVGQNGKAFYVGQIGGYITGSDLGEAAPAVGHYEGHAELKVTVEAAGV